MNINTTRTATMKLSFIAVCILVCGFFHPASAQRKANKIRRVRLEQGQSSTFLRGALRPYANHIYRLHARRGQKMTVRVESPADDVVFWVKGKESAREKYWLALEGIHRNGQTEWSGELPASGEYEIDVSNPPIGDHPVRRVLSYRIELKIE